MVAAILGTPHFNVGVEPVIALASAFADDYVHDPSEYPARIAIPSIGLTAPIQNVGINGKGEIDVPDGSTRNVGWYQYGAVPGDLGNAIMDAHVYARSKNCTGQMSAMK